MSVRETITTVFLQVAEQQHKSLALLADDVPLINSGLDSLCLAIIVARLEDDLGVDPFSSSEDVAVPETFGEFVALYENAVV
jgi:acyl carrier protein